MLCAAATFRNLHKSHKSVVQMKEDMSLAAVIVAPVTIRQKADLFFATLKFEPVFSFIAHSKLANVRSIRK